MKKIFLNCIFLLWVTSSCATSTKTQVIQPGDTQMSCEQLTNELTKLNKAQAEIDGKKGVNGTNVAAALFFWPGLLFTHMDAGQATDLITQRTSYITNLYNQKCLAKKS